MTDAVRRGIILGESGPAASQSLFAEAIVSAMAPPEPVSSFPNPIQVCASATPSGANFRSIAYGPTSEACLGLCSWWHAVH